MHELFFAFGPAFRLGRHKGSFSFLSRLCISLLRKLKYREINLPFIKISGDYPHTYAVPNAKPDARIMSNKCIFLLHHFEVIKLSKIGDRYHAFTFMFHRLGPEAEA